MDETKPTTIKQILMILAGGLIFIFGLLGIIDITTNILDQKVTDDTTANTQVEDFDTIQN